MVASYRPHVGELVAEGDDLALARCYAKMVEDVLAGLAPAKTLGVALFGNELGYVVAKGTTYLLDGGGGVFYDIVQDGGSQEPLIGRHGGDDGGSLQGVEDIGEALATALSTLMRIYGKMYGFVK